MKTHQSKWIFPRLALVVLSLLAAMWQSAVAQTAVPPQTDEYRTHGAQLMRMLGAREYGDVVGQFDAQMTQELPKEKLSKLWEGLVTQVGSFQKVGTTEVTEESGGYHVVAMNLVFERSSEGDSQVVFDKDGRIAGLYFGPQPTESANEWKTPGYADPAGQQEVAVSVAHGAWHLPGTLTLPKGKGPFPAVVLIPGSPPIDQDATVGPNKIFKDLAWGLANRGIAVLRYTKRTHQFGAGLGGGFASFTLREELDDDASSAVALLSGRSEIDRRRIFLVGHSMGGIAASRVAANYARIAGMALMGTPSEDPLTVLVKRVEGMAGAGGPNDEVDSNMRVLKQLRGGALNTAGTFDLFGQRFLVGYWNDLGNYAAGTGAAKLSVPLLVLVAGHDASVPADDFDRWKKILAGRQSATVKLYPALFHLFLPSTAAGTGDAPEDWERPAHVPLDVVNDLASWILGKTIA